MNAIKDAPGSSLDKIHETKPTAILPRTLEDRIGKRIYFQTWDWSDKSPVYKVNLFILRETDSGWETKVSSLLIGRGVEMKYLS
jgi:hypothetical protein